MSSRFLIPMLCVGAVAFACGPRAHNEASTPRKSGSSVATVSVSEPVATQQGEPRADAHAAIDGQIFVQAGDDASIRFALRVINTGKKRVELVFPSGQTYDFVILDSLGREMWRWGNGRMFTQTLRNKSLNSGEAMDLEETMRSKLPPGRYTARALLTSENYPIIEQTEFTVTGATVALR